MHVDIPADQLEILCRKWRVRELSLFGSILRDGFGREAKVDILVPFEDAGSWSIRDIIALRDDGLRNRFRRHTILSSREVVCGGSEVWHQQHATARAHLLDTNQ